MTNWTTNLRNLILTAYSIILIVGLPGNLLSLYAFSRKVKQGAKPTDVLLLSLNVSDLIFLFFLPIRIKEAADMEWTMSYFLCPLSAYIFLMNIYNSTLFLTAISVERYLGVVFAIKYKLKRRPRYAVIASVVIWVVNMAHCSIVYYMQYGFSDWKNAGLDPANNTTCYWIVNEQQEKILLPENLGIAIVAVYIPLIICLFCYVNIMRVLYQLDNIRPMKRFRATGLAVSILLIFMIFFVPFSVSNWVGFIAWCSPDCKLYVHLLTIFRVCLDPLVFYFSSKALQNTLRHCKQGVLMRTIRDQVNS